MAAARRAAALQAGVAAGPRAALAGASTGSC
jgi:hypothetical protein